MESRGRERQEGKPEDHGEGDESCQCKGQACFEGVHVMAGHGTHAERADQKLTLFDGRPLDDEIALFADRDLRIVDSLRLVFCFQFSLLVARFLEWVQLAHGGAWPRALSQTIIASICGYRIRTKSILGRLAALARSNSSAATQNFQTRKSVIPIIQR